MTLPAAFPDRLFHHNLRVHGIVAQLSVSSSLTVPATETFAETDARELSHLSESHLVIHRSSAGTRIHRIRPAADATFSVAFPFVTPERMMGSRSVPRLYLGAIDVDFRVLSGQPNLGVQGQVDAVSAYDGPDRIAHFSGLSLSGDHEDERFELDQIQTFTRGLIVVLTLGTPLGFESSFEFRSAGITLVTRGWAPLAPGDLVLEAP